MAEQEPPHPGIEDPIWAAAPARWRRDRQRYKDEVLRPVNLEISEKLYTKAAYYNNDLTDAYVLILILYHPS